ncbi:Uncharacterised protein [Burkholderia pseudomallei]|nr:Uncharacterised protein [Burkholderia pseudomallei]CAJ8381285.1 Uncharacterised protein [Burkholderia pseudomallei]CAJ9808147.1 Uncharacterised protein [Burkholderia pseudomallei]
MTGLYHLRGHMADIQLGFELDKIKNSLRGYANPTITGAKLWDLIKGASPDLNIRDVVGMPTGPGALSRFVDQHLRDVLTSNGKSGSDPIYSINIADSSLPTVDVSDSEVGLLWTTFVRSASSKIVVLTENQPFIAAVELGAIPESAKKIEGATREELDKIRIDFTQTLLDRFGDNKDGIPNARAPFPEWSNAVRKLGAQNYKDWAVFRINRIIDLFTSRLKELNVAEAQQQEFARLMRRSQSAWREASISHNSKIKTTANSHPAQSTESASVTPTSSLENQFRSAVAAAVMSLPLSDLRELKLPVGIIWDIINNNSQKN